jgi:hypothetical protein
VRIKKVRAGDGKIEISWEKDGVDGKIDEFSLSSADEPRSSFRAALHALRPHVCALAELPAEQASKIVVRGVSFSWGRGPDGGLVMGAVIVAQKLVSTSRAPLVVNTPHCPSAAYSEADAGAPVLPEATVTALNAVLAEAENYLAGARAQGSLFEDPKLAGASPAAPPAGDGETDPSRWKLICPRCKKLTDTLMDLPGKGKKVVTVCAACFEAAAKVAGGRTRPVKRASRLQTQK